jgi:DNA-binding response OmpR family regulator
MHDQRGNDSLPDRVTGYVQPVNRQAVLVVEDEPSLRLLCRINLELEGFDVFEAATLAEARAAVAKYAPSVVLLDLKIGRESGADLIGELRASTPPVPVALVTGSAALGPSVEGLADAYLRKPYTIEDLLSTVRNLASR